MLFSLLIIKFKTLDYLPSELKTQHFRYLSQLTFTS